MILATHALHWLSWSLRHNAQTSKITSSTIRFWLSKLMQRVPCQFPGGGGTCHNALSAGGRAAGGGGGSSSDGARCPCVSPCRLMQWLAIAHHALASTVCLDVLRVGMHVACAYLRTCVHHMDVAFSGSRKSAA